MLENVLNDFEFEERFNLSPNCWTTKVIKGYKFIKQYGVIKISEGALVVMKDIRIENLYSRKYSDS